MIDNEKHGIGQELDFVYITSDGNKFLDYKKAKKHQKKIKESNDGK